MVNKVRKIKKPRKVAHTKVLTTNLKLCIKAQTRCQLLDVGFEANLVALHQNNNAN